MKKVIIILSISIFSLLFFAPWLWIDIDDIEHDVFHIGKGQMFTNLKDGCDHGSIADFHWFPFGAKYVDPCFEDYYFLSFWFEIFHINEE